MPEIILLLQDNAWKAAIVQELLAQSSEGPFVVEWLRSGAAGLERLNDPMKIAVTAVLGDLSEPDGQGLETFDRIFQAWPYIPILVLSNPELEEAAKHAVQCGAQDYILDDRLDNHSLSKALRNMIKRAANAEALFVAKDRAQVTLNSIGDAVISTDAAGSVTYLNQVAEAMTGWTSTEALGRAFGDVLRIIDGTNPEHTVNPMAVAMQQDKTVGLTVAAVLVRRDGSEF